METNGSGHDTIPGFFKHGNVALSLLRAGQFFTSVTISVTQE
jgi:hypothetical protein